jgi:hypothetical protein
VAGEEKTPAASELVYAPEPSWKPAIAAFGLAALAVGVFAGWGWLAAGAALFALSVRAWVRDVADEMRRLPRRQRIVTAVLPATPMRRGPRSG